MSRQAIDLHTHSLRSDGAYQPAEVVRLAAEGGVGVQALSDHDTLAGVAEAMAAGQGLGVRIIPATELNTESDLGDVHILGYFLDPADAALEGRLRWLREHRGRRIELMVERLAELGHPVRLERVIEIAQGGSLGRPHLAQALFEAGHVPSYDAAFDTLIGRDSPAYVARVGLTPAEAVRLVRAHGGVPSLAHPRTANDLERLLPTLIEAGLGGVECYYGSTDPDVAHSPEYTAYLLELSRRHDLVPTGGSDFHGRGEHGAPLGSVSVPLGTIEALEARRGPAPVGEGAAGPYHVDRVERAR